MSSARPFPPDYRASGLQLHVTSLPSRFGIGDLGPGAFAWIDRLHDAGQTWWQALPLGPTGYTNSPYQCLSSFAGNGLIISPELLIEDGLLRVEDCYGAFSSTQVDYDVVIRFKHGLLPVLWSRFRAGVRKDLLPGYEEFCERRANWLDDYALFRALKQKHGGVSYLDWPDELLYRVPSAIASAKRELADLIDEVRFAQFLLSRQASRVKEYARSKRLCLIGDLPFFVSPDSADVWARPDLFLLDGRCRPRVVAGVPPDCFSDQGQLWGNPIYDWDALAREDYAWCIERIKALLAHVDIIRLDHFRAFAAAWHIPAAAPTAQTGEWVPGPGARFFLAAQKHFGCLPFFAEDLGMITPDIEELRKRFEIPGTRVLQFAFDGNRDNPHLPENYSANTVVYTGTHDNATSREWFEDLSREKRAHVWEGLPCHPGEIQDVAHHLIRLAWSSRAAVAITPLQDLLNLGREGRMNVPGRPTGNWRWRATGHMLSTPDFAWLRDVTNQYNRSAMNADRFSQAEREIEVTR
jgi:4-alpha-glucanotransferase